jgi:hypothetical protein
MTARSSSIVRTLCRGALAATLLAVTACRPQLGIVPVGPLSRTPQGRISQLFRVVRGRDPVPNLPRDRFAVMEESRVIPPGEGELHVDLRPQAFRLYAVLLLDVSGSQRDRLPELRESARNFVQRLLDGTTAADNRQVAVFVFSGAPAIYPLLTEDARDFSGTMRPRARASSDIAELSRAIDGVNCDAGTTNAYCADRSTNLNGATVAALRAMRELEDQGEHAGVQEQAGALVVFTDGADEAGRVRHADLAAALAAVEPNEYVFTIGLGASIDTAALREIGRDGFVTAADYPALSGAFETIARQVSDVANSYYFLQYCSPSRTGQPVHLTLPV